ncbi:translation initiation factor IF-2-like [Panthera pardus]|uniref:Translation initiation factor IF-2-like n=1 Tax=Panthera pardus TaxID=9691 RepID=A0A9V1FFP2_PANPR|nr:translation initiation factor IF-2-like [Panthera pardus]
MASYLSPLHKHHRHVGFRGQLRERSLQAPGVLCGTKAERGAGQSRRPGPRREVHGGGGASASPTAPPPAAARGPGPSPRTPARAGRRVPGRLPHPRSRRAQILAASPDQTPQIPRASGRKPPADKGRPVSPQPRLGFHRPTRHNERGPQEHRLTPSFTPTQTHLKTSLSGVRSAPDRRLPTSPASQPRGSQPYPGFWVPTAYVKGSAGPPGSSGGRPPTFRSEALRRHCEGLLRTEGKGGGLPAATRSHALLGAGGRAARVRMTKQKSTPVQPWRLRQRA